MTQEQLDLIEKAKKSLQAAQLLLTNDLADFAASRAYYTMFLSRLYLLDWKGAEVFQARFIDCGFRSALRQNRRS